MHLCAGNTGCQDSAGYRRHRRHHFSADKGGFLSLAGVVGASGTQGDGWLPQKMLVAYLRGRSKQTWEAVSCKVLLKYSQGLDGDGGVMSREESSPID